MKQCEKFRKIFMNCWCKKRLKKLDVLLYGFVHIFLCLLTPKIPYVDYMLSVLELGLSTEFECTNTGYLMCCFNDLWLYLHMFTFQYASCYIEAIKLCWLPFLYYYLYLPQLNSQTLKSGQFSKSWGWLVNRGPTVVLLTFNFEMPFLQTCMHIFVISWDVLMIIYELFHFFE